MLICGLSVYEDEQCFWEGDMKRYTLENHEIQIEFLAMGGCITKIINKKTKTNYVLSYDDLWHYCTNPYFFGAIIGRNAGRTFPAYYLSHKKDSILLDKNEKGNHLHGGAAGFHLREFRIFKKNLTTYELRLDNDSGPYERMAIKISYRIEKNVFTIEIEGEAEVPTVCNLTNHAYFNLDREKRTIEDHLLKMADAKLQLIDEQFIPTGEYIDFQSCTRYQKFDFTTEKRIGEAFDSEEDLSKICSGGIDLGYCFKKRNQHPLISLSNRARTNWLHIRSNQECAVIYTLNKIAEQNLVSGSPVQKHQGITFEMQRRPNYVHELADYLDKNYYSITEYIIE